MKTYEVIKETKIVDNNTPDALQIKVYEESSGETEIALSDGSVVSGDNLAVKKFLGTQNLGNLKTRLQEINSLLESLPEEKKRIEEDIAILEPIMEVAIEEILSEPDSVDNRK